MVALGRYSLHGYYTLDTATIATKKGTLMREIMAQVTGAQDVDQGQQNIVHVSAFAETDRSIHFENQQSLCNAPRNNVMLQEILTFSSLHSILALLSGEFAIHTFICTKLFSFHLQHKIHYSSWRVNRYNFYFVIRADGT